MQLFLNKPFSFMFIFALFSGTLIADQVSKTAKKPIKKKRTPPPVRSYQDVGAPKFTLLNEADSLKDLLDKNGNYVSQAPYIKAVDIAAMKTAPKGTIHQFTLNSKDGKIYNPGIARKVFGTPDPKNPNTLIVDTHEVDFSRVITVYIPKQIDRKTPNPFMISHDGPKKMDGNNKGLNTIMDQLIAQKRIPPMLLISIANGGGDAQGHQRGKEYDTMSGLFAEYIESHILPEVVSRFKVKLTKDPSARAVMGVSSGASAALAMAWYRNDLYQRVISFSGTFVNQQWPYNPETPGGAWEFHQSLIPNQARKKIRIWLAVGDRDLLNPNIMRDGMHDWVEANHRMAKALKEKGYEYQYFFCEENKHGMRPAREQFTAHAIEWAWRTYHPSP